MSETTEELSLTLKGKDTLAIVTQLCTATGMTPPCLVALMVRKYGQDLVSWVGHSPTLLAQLAQTPTDTPKPIIELPTDPGEHLLPVEL